MLLPPLGLYIHLPWCERKCPYCDFNSHETRSVPEQRYIEALLRDLREDLPSLQGRKIETLFIGGGTPSLFSPEGIDRLIGQMRARLKFAPDCEITLEANPGTFERERFRAYGSASEVVRMFKDDLSSEPAKDVHRDLRDLGLPTLDDVRDDFEDLARRLKVG